MEKVIQKLKDDKHYYGEFGKKYLSNSDIDALINNPLSFQADKPQSLPFLYGTAFHEMAMFGKSDSMESIESSTRSTKIYKQSILDNGKEIMLLNKEADEIRSDYEKQLRNVKARTDTLINPMKYQYKWMRNVFGVFTSLGITGFIFDSEVRADPFNWLFCSFFD